MTYSDLFSELVRTEILLWDSLDARLLSELGLSVSQWQALAAIAALPGAARVQDISATMSITVGSTSKLVDRLERDGLAFRQSNPDDRRSSLVTLTEKGAADHAAATTAAEKYLSRIIGHPDISVSELTSILVALRNVAGAKQ